MIVLLQDLCHNTGMEPEQATLNWLLEGDPAIRWHVMRDVLEEPPAVYRAERAKVATQGWGQRLLAEQDPDGNWGGGLYSPKWISTTYTLLTLRHLGLIAPHPQAQRGCEHFLERDFERDGGINLFKSARYSETCVNGMILAVLSYFRHPGEAAHRVAEFLRGEQMPDGGWNCQWNPETRQRTTHASFNTTILVLEGLAEYANAYPQMAADVAPAIERGHEFFFVHQLYKSHRTGKMAYPAITRMPFPPRWHYDFLRGLDYLQSVGARRDPRAADAIGLLFQKRSPDGRWALNTPWPARVFFQMESPGEPSRWNTLRALRVLKWWGTTPAPWAGAGVRVTGTPEATITPTEAVLVGVSPTKAALAPQIVVPHSPRSPRPARQESRHSRRSRPAPDQQSRSGR